MGQLVKSREAAFYDLTWVSSERLYKRIHYRIRGEARRISKNGEATTWLYKPMINFIRFAKIAREWELLSWC